MEYQDIRLSVSETAKIFGLSEQTIRRALKSEELKYIVVKGRYKISFFSVLKWSQSSPRKTNSMNNHGIGQFVDTWKINNKRYSPHPKTVARNVKIEKNRT